MAIYFNGEQVGNTVSTFLKFKDVVSRDITTLTDDDLYGFESIGAYAFSECLSLTNVILPETIKLIEANAFMSDRALVSMKVKAQIPPSLAPNAIPTTIQEIKVPMASLDAYKEAVNWSDYKDKIIGYE